MIDLARRGFLFGAAAVVAAPTLVKVYDMSVVKRLVSVPNVIDTGAPLRGLNLDAFRAIVEPGLRVAFDKLYSEPLIDFDKVYTEIERRT